MVISASWFSRTGNGNGNLNLRGVSTVLALAAFLKRRGVVLFASFFDYKVLLTVGYSLWAKDLVFVISDGYLDGMHAWLSAYHGSVQSSKHSIHIRALWCN